MTLGRYRGPARRAVQALKYRGAREAAPLLGQALAAAVPDNWRIAAVVPVPLHPSRERERGYNQSALIAAALAEALDVPCRPEALRRERRTAQQAKLSGDLRRANVQGAFVAQPLQLPEGAALLVDDVLTTGHTLAACRDALLACEPRDLYYAVVAH